MVRGKTETQAQGLANNLIQELMLEFVSLPLVAKSLNPTERWTAVQRHVGRASTLADEQVSLTTRPQDHISHLI